MPVPAQGLSGLSAGPDSVQAVSIVQDDDDEAGGPVAVNTSDPGVVAAARFAVNQQARNSGATIRLVSVDQAKRQLVSGINYFLCLSVEMGGETTQVHVTVYNNGNQNRLGKWVVKACD